MAGKMEFIVISIPDTPQNNESYKLVQNTLRKLQRKHGEIESFKFYVPTLKSETFDKLLNSLEFLERLETLSESTTLRLCQAAKDLMVEDQESLRYCLTADGVSLYEYLRDFKWDVAQYPTRQGINTVSYLMEKQLDLIDTTLSSKLWHYTNVISSLTAMKNKEQGTLMTKFLGDEVKSDDFILDSEFLETLVVVVPKRLRESWMTKYERLHAEVVPKSTKLISKDDEFELYSVTLFKRAKESFSEKAREFNFTVRNFVYDEKEISSFKTELWNLQEEERKLYMPLLRWCTTNFGEAFKACVHAKATKVFVESVLRYGIPPKFQAVLIIAYEKIMPKIKKTLDQTFANLAVTINTKTPKKQDDGVSWDSDYHPYVCVRIKGDITEILNLKSHH